MPIFRRKREELIYVASFGNGSIHKKFCVELFVETSIKNKTTSEKCTMLDL